MTAAADRLPHGNHTDAIIAFFDPFILDQQVCGNRLLQGGSLFYPGFRILVNGAQIILDYFPFLLMIAFGLR
jgi:hypothetical protein